MEYNYLFSLLVACIYMCDCKTLTYVNCPVHCVPKLFFFYVSISNACLYLNTYNNLTFVLQYINIDN